MRMIFEDATTEDCEIDVSIKEGGGEKFVQLKCTMNDTETLHWLTKKETQGMIDWLRKLVAEMSMDESKTTNQ